MVSLSLLQFGCLNPEQSLEADQEFALRRLEQTQTPTRIQRTTFDLTTQAVNQVQTFPNKCVALPWAILRPFYRQRRSLTNRRIQGIDVQEHGLAGRPFRKITKNL